MKRTLLLSLMAIFFMLFCRQVFCADTSATEPSPAPSASPSAPPAMAATPVASPDITAEGVVRQFYECMKKGDVETMMTLVSEEMATKIKSSESPEDIGVDLGAAVMVTNAVKEGRLKLEFKNFSIITEKQSSESAFIKATYTVEIEEAGKKESEKAIDFIELKMEKGKWTIEKLKDTPAE